MTVSPSPVSRPRTVVATFWCWVVAAVLIAALGLVMATTPIAVFFRLVGVLMVIVGLAQGFLAGRARDGRIRFAAAGVGLALAIVVLLVILLLFSILGLLGVVLAGVIMILLITGSAMSQRPTSQQWYESRGAV